MEGFFDGVDVVAEAMASASGATAQRAPAETLISPSEAIPAEESTQAERTLSGESAPISAETPTPQKEVTPTGTSQTESTSVWDVPVGVTSRLRVPLLLLLQSYLLVTPSLPFPRL